ncbi:MAG: DOMON-like domain-containing protein [Bdellovibrionota bacterium]
MLASFPLQPWDPSTSNSLALMVKLHRSRDVIHFTFELSGQIGPVVIPEMKPKADRTRTDELWRKTCFELFLGNPNTEYYVEINVSPNGDWNAYYFDSYRAGMRPVTDAKIDLEVDSTSSASYILRGSLQSLQDGELGTVFSRSLIEVSATAVIERAGSETQYWAVKHAGAKPDFHLRPSFTIQLTPSTSSKTSST